jgi:D-sedoheptulose 7-phosphate isomerase
VGQLNAVRLAVRYSSIEFGPEFLILYGDSYLPDLDLAAIVAQGRQLKRPVQAVWTGVEFGRDYGVTYMRADALPNIPEDATMGGLTHHGYAVPFGVDKKYMQIGDPDGLKEVEWFLSQKDEFADKFLTEIKTIADKLDRKEIEAVIAELIAVRERNGKVFVLGNGGSFANASHFVNDARKLANLEAYCPENCSEITAHVNDHGWRGWMAQWLKGCRMTANDCVLVLSVGGAQDQAPASSVNIAYAVQEANRTGTPVIGILGKDGGYVRHHAKASILVPTISPDLITPMAESWQSCLLHLFISDSRLKRNPTRW